jgi:hypothetical protein
VVPNFVDEVMENPGVCGFFREEVSTDEKDLFSMLERSKWHLVWVRVWRKQLASKHNDRTL